MTTPIDPDARIAELRIVAHGLGSIAHFAREAWNGNDGAEGDAVRRLCEAAEKFEPLLALASELAEKLRKAGDSHCALLELLSAADDRTRDEEKDHAETKRSLTIATEALENIASGSPVQCLIARLGEGTIECGVGDKACAACRAARVVEGARREIEQEREKVSGLRDRIVFLLSRLPMAERLAANRDWAEASRDTEPRDEHGRTAFQRLHGLCSAGHALPRNEQERASASCSFCKRVPLEEPHPSPQPPLPACKRCGKPVAHPAQEYCGAACSVERGRAVEGAVCRVCGHLNVACWCEAGKAREGSE